MGVGRVGRVGGWLAKGLGVLLEGTDPQLASLNYEVYYFDVTGLEQEWMISRY